MTELHLLEKRLKKNCLSKKNLLLIKGGKNNKDKDKDKDKDRNPNSNFGDGGAGGIPPEI